LTTNHLPEPRIVCFIDILGFKDSINNMENHPETFFLIKNILEYSEKLLKEMCEKLSIFPQKIQYSQFSDSIILTCPCINEDVGSSEITIILLAYSLLLSFMMNGVFIRGGIAKGWCYHEGNIVFGKGILNAYDLEKNFATNPRIIVSTELINDISQQYNYIKINFLKIDKDGFYYINAFNYGQIVKLVRTRSDEESVTKKSLITLRKHITTQLIKSKDLDPRIRTKYHWLAGQFNDLLDEQKNDPDVGFLLLDIDKISY
jgi:hypothetical protein